MIPKMKLEHYNVHYRSSLKQTSANDYLFQDPELLIVSAQVHYFLPNTDRAYFLLVMFFDEQVTSNKVACGCCYQRSNENAVKKHTQVAM